MWKISQSKGAITPVNLRQDFIDFLMVTRLAIKYFNFKIHYNKLHNLITRWIVFHVKLGPKS